MSRVDDVRSQRPRAQLALTCVLLCSAVLLLAAAVAPPVANSRPAPASAVALRAAFARAVAIAGNWAFVGEPAVAGGGRGGGAPAGGGLVHVYQRDATGWKVVDKLTAPDSTTRDGFGLSLAAEGNTLLVGHVRGVATAGGGGRGGRGGAPPQAAPAQPTAGTVTVYRLGTNRRWAAAGTLPGGTAGGQFGAALAVRGNVALVGAPNEGGTGAVFVFARANANAQWTPAGTLPNAGLSEGDRFGAAVALNGDRLVVGAPGREAKGAVYLYRRQADGSWAAEGTAIRSLRLNDGAELGSAVAISNDMIIAGAPAGTFATAPAAAPAAAPGAAPTGGPTPAGGGGRGGRGGLAPAPGLVIVFQKFGGIWKEGATLAPFDIAGARFGAATSVVGGELWIGAPGSDGIGRIYRARRDQSGEWNTMIKLLDPNVDMNAQFGAAFAVDGNNAVIGMPGDGAGGGTVAFFERSQAGEWRQRGSDFPAPAERMGAITGREALCAEGKVQQFDCQGVSLVSFLPLSEIGAKRGVRLSGSWGWTDPVTGKDISIIGRSDGTAFVDITDPLRPKYLGELMRPRGTSQSTWREMKTYKNFVLVVSDGSGDRHGVQIFDLTRLRNVTTPQRFNADAHYDLGSVHNIVVSEQTGYAYAVGVNSSGENCGGGSHIIDIRNPLEPKFAGCFQDAATGRRGTGYTHDGQCVIYKGPDTRYTGREICVMSNETHISIHDMTDKANPKVVGRASYPTAGYVHQTWFTEDQRYIFLDDELDEGGFQGTAAAFGNQCPCGTAAEGTRTLVWDMTDLTDPILKKEYIATTKETDHNQYVKGNRLYQSNYGAGLRILDISDPANPREVGYLNTGGSSWSNYPWFKNGTIAFTTGSQGLFIIRDRTVNTVFEQ